MRRRLEIVANSKFAHLAGQSAISIESTARPMPLLYRKVISAGWVVRDDAWLLAYLLKHYYGSRSYFTDITGYESAVNGRAVPLDGLAARPPAKLIAERAIGFAVCALDLLQDESLSVPPITAYVSVGSALYDESLLEGSVTFCSERPSEPPYATDLEAFDAGIVAIRSSFWPT